jgi:Ca2+-binding EF-hand superfamily protein
LGAVAAAEAAAKAAAKTSSSAYASSVSASISAASSAASNAALRIFQMIDADQSGTISKGEAERIVLRLNSRLNRAYGENDVKAFFTSITGDNDTITQEEFITAFQRMVLDA